jgi:hypothetical protein
MNFCDERIAMPLSGGLPLESFLIAPVQRVPRHKLLVEELIRKWAREPHTDAEAASVDIALLSETVEIVNWVLALINVRTKEEDGRRRTFQLYDAVGGRWHIPGGLLVPFRRHIAVVHGFEYVVGATLMGSTQEAREVHLLSDYLVMLRAPSAHRKVAGGRAVLVRCWDLRRCYVGRVLRSDDLAPVAVFGSPERLLGQLVEPFERALVFAFAHTSSCFGGFVEHVLFLLSHAGMLGHRRMLGPCRIAHLNPC